MKSCRIICCLLIAYISTCSISFAQGIDKDHVKYWKLRHRMRTLFAEQAVAPPGNTDLKGYGFPANSVNGFADSHRDLPGYYRWFPEDWGPFSDLSAEKQNVILNQKAIGGDGTSLLAWYIAVLATEYKLLSDKGLSTQSTLEELFFAMRALEQCDALAEKWLRTDDNGSQGRYQPAPDSYCDLNGMFMRNYASTYEYETQPFVPPVEISSKVWTDNNRLRRLNGYYLLQTTYDSTWGIDEPAPKDGYGCDPPGQNTPGDYKQCGEGDWASTDHMIYVTFGLAFVKKFIPKNLTYSHPGHPEFNFHDRAVDFVTRMWLYAKGPDNTWLIRIPRTNRTVPRGPAALFWYWGIRNALNFFHDQQLPFILNIFPVVSNVEFVEADLWNLGPTFGGFNYELSEGDKFLQVAAILAGTAGSALAYDNINYYRKLYSVAPVVFSTVFNNPCVGNTYNSAMLMALTSVCDCINLVIPGLPIVGDLPFIKNNIASLALLGNASNLYIFNLGHQVLHGTGSWISRSIHKSYLDALDCEGPRYRAGFETEQTIPGSGTHSNEKWRNAHFMIHTACENEGDKRGEFAGLGYMLYYNLYLLASPQESQQSGPYNSGIVNWMDLDVSGTFPRFVSGHTPCGSHKFYASDQCPANMRAFNSATVRNATIRGQLTPDGRSAVLDLRATNRIDLLPSTTIGGGLRPTTFSARIDPSIPTDCDWFYNVARVAPTTNLYSVPPSDHEAIEEQLLEEAEEAENIRKLEEYKASIEANQSAILAYLKDSLGLTLDEYLELMSGDPSDSLLKRIAVNTWYYYNRPSVQAGVASSVGFALHPPQPNPAGNTETTLSYDLGARVSVTLQVVTATGVPVATVVQAEQTAGRYSVSFPTQRLAGGVYTVHLSAGTFQATQQLVIIRD